MISSEGSSFPNQEQKDALVSPNEDSSALASMVENVVEVDSREDARELTLSQAMGRLTKLEEAVKTLFENARQRLQETNKRVADWEETLLTQIAELETTQRQTLQAVDNRLAELTLRMETLEAPRIAAEQRALREQNRQSAYQQAWQSAPLPQRLRFVRELLPETHGLSAPLKEMESLEDLRQRGRELENWLLHYPSLFADALQTLFANSGSEDENTPEDNSAALLALQTLAEGRATLEMTLQALGIVWVAPEPGEPITGEHEVVADEAGWGEVGSIARLRRRGFRLRGRLLLPAQVFRVGTLPPTKREQEPALPASPSPLIESRPSSNEVQNAPPVHVQNAGQETPGWLKILQQRAFNCPLPAVSALVVQAAALVTLPARLVETQSPAEASEIMTDALQPVLPLLGLRFADSLPDIPLEWGQILLDARPDLLNWLSEKLQVVVLSPTRGTHFDPETMEAVKTSRTAHAHEENTVGKLERVGLLWQNRPLLRAQVMRYASGENG